MSQNVTPKQKRAIAALLTARTLEEAAKQASVNRRTLSRWLELPTFRAALEEAERDAIAGLSRSLVVLGDKATLTLREAMDGKENPTGAKVRAADIVLSRLLQLRELYSLEERVSRLEEAQ